MSWKNVLSIVAVSALLGVPLQTLGDNDRNGRSGGHDRDRYDRDHQQRERDRQAKKAAQDAQWEAQLITRFTVLAGSTANATSLVQGVHNDTLVTLTSSAAGEVIPCTGRFPPPDCGLPSTVIVTETFTPPTGPLKYKQVAIALALMEAKLKDLYPGIVTATPVQIRDVLVGVQPDGILTMRAAKLHWLQIAHRQGLLVSHTTHVKGTKGDGKHHDDDDDDDND